MKKTKQQIKNLKDALYNWWPTVPEANVYKNLGWWRLLQGGDPPAVTCNTVACFGGWACLWPPLQAQGLMPTHSGIPSFIDAAGNETYLSGDNILFGDSDLFSVRGGHPADADSGKVSDHKLVRNRLKWALREKDQQ